MKRAVLIITDAREVTWNTYDKDGHCYGATGGAEPSPQLLADLRTLAEFPNLLAVEFADARLRYSTVQVDVGDWGEAKAAAARVHDAIGDA